MNHEGNLEATDAILKEEDADSLTLLLAEIRVPVEDDFASRVMSRLPDPGWKKRGRGQWLWAAAAIALLVVGSALLLSFGNSPLGGAAAAVGDLFAATLAAGAGFAAASWSGLGHAVDAALDGSVSALVGLGIAALGANLLLLRLVRRRRAVARERTHDE